MANAASDRPPVPRPSRPRGTRVFLVTASIVAILVSIGSGLSIATIRHAESVIQKVHVGGCTGSNCLPSVQPTCIKKACTFLVLGSDSRAGLSGSFGTAKTVPGQRADTIILVQVDPVHGRTVVLSIPRDLRVAIPGHGMNKINTAFQYGPDVMVRAVRQLTGFRINHYVQVNFAGFQKLVDALGGVPICIDKPLYDKLAGLNLPHKGCYNLKGGQALAFVRARHIQGDLIPDFSRISRQQQFIRAVIEKSLSVGSVFQLPKLIKAVEKNLVIDENLNLYSLQDLTRKIASVGQRGVLFRVVPAVPVDIGGVSYVQLVEPQASELFQKMAAGQPLGQLGVEELATPISPANITVRVYDANSGGKAGQLVAYLQKAGFVVEVAPGPAPKSFTKTIMLWGPQRQNQEQVVSAYLPGIPIRFERVHTKGVDVAVVVGPDFKGIEF
jgi:polyisoprenyl-teichoic acid--peptidoglycan teichoic acid transferase